MNPEIIAMNFIYAILGVILTLGSMVGGLKLFDKITPFNTHDELAKGNDAVGRVVGAMFIALGLAIGLVVGLGLN
jgi:uncharacterized membrane protein YjfL (UPF0719 family)